MVSESEELVVKLGIKVCIKINLKQQWRRSRATVCEISLKNSLVEAVNLA